MTARKPTNKQKLDSIMDSIDKFKGVDTFNETNIQKIKREFDSKIVQEGFYSDFVLKTLDVIKSNEEF